MGGQAELSSLPIRPNMIEFIKNKIHEKINNAIHPFKATAAKVQQMSTNLVGRGQLLVGGVFITGLVVCQNFIYIRGMMMPEGSVSSTGAPLPKKKEKRVANVDEISKISGIIETSDTDADKAALWQRLGAAKAAREDKTP